MKVVSKVKQIGMNIIVSFEDGDKHTKVIKEKGERDSFKALAKELEGKANPSKTKYNRLVKLLDIGVGVTKPIAKATSKPNVPDNTVKKTKAKKKPAKKVVDSIIAVVSNAVETIKTSRVKNNSNE
jgi:hypothetical protein